MEESRRRRRSSLSLRASWKPFGIGEQRPNNFREVTRAAWENRDQASYAWRILNQGVCDGCALGTKGMRDWTVDGVHLCNIRLRLLRLNTMRALDPAQLADVGWAARAVVGRAARDSGGFRSRSCAAAASRGFTRIAWDEAMDLTAEQIRASGPERARHLPHEPGHGQRDLLRGPEGGAGDGHERDR